MFQSKVNAKQYVEGETKKLILTLDIDNQAIAWCEFIKGNTEDHKTDLRNHEKDLKKTLWRIYIWSISR